MAKGRDQWRRDRDQWRRARDQWRRGRDQYTAHHTTRSILITSHEAKPHKEVHKVPHKEVLKVHHKEALKLLVSVCTRIPWLGVDVLIRGSSAQHHSSQATTHSSVLTLEVIRPNRARPRRS